MQKLISETADYLVGKGEGTLGSTIFIGQSPPNVVNCILITPTGGARPVLEKTTKSPTIQILIRNTSFNTASTKAKTIFDYFDDSWNVLSTIKGRCIGNHLPGPYYVDESGNFVFTLNMTFVITQKSFEG